MSDYRKNSHSITGLSCHLVWATKYRYSVLKGDVQTRCRDVLVQVCDSEDVRILKGVVSKDHVHMHIEYPPSLSISVLVKKLKGRSSRLLQREFPVLAKKYWGRHFWAVGYGAWSTGKITDEMVQEYLEHHKGKPNSKKGNWILE
ncbi:IS200/IS605 family transposase [Sediminicola luteus]|uniref:IS200/IS605 family transposase n=1 Tax=Sediminicola luteus TaxID=319238 RepID=A0A2A4G7A1_9FLAO|nr:IS200/IS605 family transposase [Sediminicola luteus]PCE63635.1 IS200/IS605 family transposase [Sediminicola luteus]